MFLCSFNVLLGTFCGFFYAVVNSDNFPFLFLMHIICVCNVLCIEINFFVFWSISLSSYLVYIKNGPGHLANGTVLVFIPLMKFQPQRLVSRFFCSLEQHFLKFLSSSVFVWSCPLPIFSNIVFFLHFNRSEAFLVLAVLFLPLFHFSYFLSSAWYIFLYKIPICILVVNSYC